MKENGLCKDCKWWGLYLKGVCDKVGNIDVEKGFKKFSIEARADDDQGLEAYLVTGPDFGCIHFINK